MGARVTGPRGQLISPGHFVRHGSPDRRSEPRRPRSRDPRTSSQNEATLRSGPAGPMERQEWVDALANVQERITTVERSQRNLAQNVAAVEVVGRNNTDNIQSMATDIGKYKE